ncbi:MAG TPA: cyclic 2,3-diphosphoglycerate synthase [Acidobacteriota bacterium]
MTSTPTRVVILGAAGRDFHNFNAVYREDGRVEVVAFTATQIPGIAGRRYPPGLAGPRYPHGIPIEPEEDLERIIRERGVDQVVFAYSDVSHEQVMHLASRTLAAGADFALLGPRRTMLRSPKPVVAVCAVRTGCGKSAVSRRVARILGERGRRVAVVRHPMPYGDLLAGRVQRFAAAADLDRAQVTIEEREEYEPHLRNDVVVFAGVDYEAILRAAEQEADIIVWDGGNNDLPLIKPDLEIVVLDPLRQGHETTYYPGETNFRRADVLVINKITSAEPAAVDRLREAIQEVNPGALVVDAASPLFLDGDATDITGKRVLVIEDGPTLTHGEMAYGAGVVAARKFGAAEIVGPKPYAVRSIADTFAKYPQTEMVLPAMGYGDEQIADLEATIRATPCDLVLIATPIDLRLLVDFHVPAMRVTYELQEIGEPTLEGPLRSFVG